SPSRRPAGAGSGGCRGGSMKLPGGERAVVRMDKPIDYTLDPEHERGGHKARVFAAALGITVDNAEELRDALLEAARTGEARFDFANEHGQQYLVDFEMVGPSE